MTDPYPEYRNISVTDPLRQGDILEAADPAASHWQRHLLVITADCDFAHAKHQGRVTCVPVLTAQEYLLEMQIPRIREAALKKFVATLRATLASTSAANISDQRLRAWPCETAPGDIVASLELDARKTATARAALESIRLASQPAESLGQAVEFLIDSYLAASAPQKRDNIVNGIVSKLKGPYSQPPGDALFLSAIAPECDLGYFVYLRHLEQVREADIALGPTRRTANYRRIARLQDRYAHALVQRFALVFMSIGLPAEYEEIRELHSDYLGENFK
ncbi:hypothetical protein [Amycolatopsis sp. WAC 01376]|uniref:hypothetical protein n=1 Tax=Amycolatopsis sp. WAC 01376 TaxID=2203195 RepID=UPI000F77155D|nr:hypothetical protein [Amycolatopsis sp. WAC 01376]